jgi:predicted RNA-binding protein
MYNYYVPKGEYISIYVYRMKGKNYMIISIDTENSFDKFNILS